MKRHLGVLILILVNMSSIWAGAAAEDQRDWTAASWEEIVAAADGSEVNFYMWGGSAAINSWIDGYVAPAIKAEYNITLHRVPLDASVFINQLLGEKAANRGKGSIDLMWINGENFSRARQEGLLYGSFAAALPNMKLVDPESVALDFGTPVDGWEVPYGRAQFVLEYDSRLIPNPPTNLEELTQWIEANPGKFTYPQPPDFTGSAFLRQLLYATSGGVQTFSRPFSTDTFAIQSQALWDYLNHIKPFLWQGGETYPADKSRLDLLFEQGEVAFNMTYTQAEASGRIADGRYPETVRTLVLEEGSISNIHFTSIPWNAPNVPAAMVLANFLLSPEAQYSKNIPENWGDFSVLDPSRLSSEWQEKFAALDLGIATLPLTELAKTAVPEIHPNYLEAIEDLWLEEVLEN